MVEKEVLGMKCTATWEWTYIIYNVFDKQTFESSKKPVITNVNTSSAVEIPNAGKLAQLQKPENITISNENPINSWAQKYILLSNIDLSAAGLANWKSIGTETDAFKGVFDGNNYKIYNIPEFAIKDTRVGFFGYLDGGTIQNCGFIYKDGTTLKSTEDVGGVVGRIVNGEVIGVSSSGAIVSHNENDDISYGGLVGSIANGTISNSSNYNTVSAKNNAGGIVGDANGDNSITGCNNFGVIKDASRSAGIVGQLVSGSVSNCSNYNSITATNSVSGIANYSQWGDAKTGQGTSGEIHRKGKESGQSYTVGVVTWVVTNWDYYADSIEYSLYYRGQHIYSDKYKDFSSTEKTITVTSFISSLTGSVSIGIRYHKIDGGSGLGALLRFDQYVYVNINYNIQEKIGNSGSFSSCHDFGSETISELDKLESEVVYYTTKTGKLIWMTRQDGFSIYSVDNKVVIPYEEGAVTSSFGPTMLLPGGNICRIYDLDSESSQSLWRNSTSSVNPTDDGVYNIYTAKRLAWIAQEINKDGGLVGKTINILNDIDLTGKVWEPIKNISDSLTWSYTKVKDENESFDKSAYGFNFKISYSTDKSKLILEIYKSTDRIFYREIEYKENTVLFEGSYNNFTFTVKGRIRRGYYDTISISKTNTFNFNGYNIFGLGKGAYEYKESEPIFTKDSYTSNIRSGNVYSHPSSGAVGTESEEFDSTTLVGENFTNPIKIGNYWYAYYDGENSEGKWVFYFFKSSDSVITTDFSDICAHNLIRNWLGNYVDITLTDKYQLIHYDKEQNILFYAKKGGWKYEKLIN